MNALLGLQAHTWLTALCATTSEHAAPGSPEAAAAAVVLRISCHASDARYHSSLPGAASLSCMSRTMRPQAAVAPVMSLPGVALTPLACFACFAPCAQSALTASQPW